MLTFCRPGQAAEPPELSVQFVGTEHPSSFVKLIHVHVLNPAYTPADLAGMVASSQLIVDGKPSARTDAPFPGPPGIPSVSEWDGCLSPVDYTPPVPPGKHKIRFKLGDTQSEAVTVRWGPPLDWRKGTLETRLKEVKELSEALKGLPRSCVEQWLTVRDGGVQDPAHIRYFLEPFIKVVVPYSHAEDPTGEHALVDGPVQVYQETRLRD